MLLKTHLKKKINLQKSLFINIEKAFLIFKKIFKKF